MEPGICEEGIPWSMSRLRSSEQSRAGFSNSSNKLLNFATALRIKMKFAQKSTVRGIQDKSSNEGAKPWFVRLCFGGREISVAVELRQR